MSAQSVKTPTLTPDDHLFLFSTAVDTLQKIVDLPDEQLKFLLDVDGFAYQHGLLAGYLFILETKVLSLEEPLDHTILLTDLGLLNSGDACRHSAQSPDAVGQGGN